MATARTSRKPPSRRNTAELTGRSSRAIEPQAREPSIVDLIVRKLQEEIVLGRRHPRERLVEQDLCVAFDTHRGDVRLALFELEKMGIVERIPNRGAIVRDLKPRDVRDIYAVREELEVMAVNILPFPVPDADIARLEAIQHAHGKAVDAGDLLAVFHNNVQFHRALFGLCGNTCLIETIEHLAQKASGIRSYAHAMPEALNDARRDHVAMIKALHSSRRDHLVDLTRRHLKPAVLAYVNAYRLRFGEADA
ncbi:GntR family transcriptional regulator [Bradyrhizobium sp.]|uniref:GntR family transcriptional regulator n=1 Tax=Bradyrhizobium sp. TaxID=376 RepID=UPI001D21825D|nr:GntR family transcriptional regulator [Bradyrhizobium sp.]MBI5320776.1 GntR family transcriptional regulator [Bradyrhizobium sp.]